MRAAGASLEGDHQADRRVHGGDTKAVYAYAREDYRVVEHELRFDRPLEKERIGIGRWTAIFFGLFGHYGKNDSVDVQYQLGGRDQVAVGLEIVPPD